MIDPIPSVPGITGRDLASARATATQLLDAVVAGDEATARAALLVRPGETIDFQSMRESTAGYALGDTTAEDPNVVVLAKIEPPAGKDAPPVLPLVLVRVEGRWLVDMSASVNRMLGVNLDDLMKQMAEGLGNAMAAGLSAVAEGMSALSQGGGADVAPAAGTAEPHPAPEEPKREKGKRKHRA